MTIPRKRICHATNKHSRNQVRKSIAAWASHLKVYPMASLFRMLPVVYQLHRESWLIEVGFCSSQCSHFLEHAWVRVAR